MNIDYIETKEISFATNEEGKVKQIEPADKTVEILIEENKIEWLESLKEQIKEKKDACYVPGIEIFMKCLAAFFGTSIFLVLFLMASSWIQIILILCCLGLTVAITPIAIISDLKEKKNQCKNLEQLLKIVEDRYQEEKEKLAILSKTAKKIEPQEKKIISLEEKEELLKRKKYLLAIKLLSLKMHKLEKLDQKKLEAYLGKKLQNKEVENIMIDMMNKTRTRKEK